MVPLLRIAAEEWRHAARSHLTLAASALFALLVVATTVLTAVRMEAEHTTRLAQQKLAEDTFLAQPDRHPHRMVHYGHYVFRSPAPLAVVDPGLDPVTGQAVFLEGHRQNSATFADAAASADLGGLSGLTPAVVYQLFGPLLLILLGHGALVRERETGTLPVLLAHGVGGGQLLAGKGLALASVAGVMLVPLAVVVVTTTGPAEWAAGFALVGLYALYLGVWVGLTLLASALLHSRAAVLATLVAVWLVTSLLLPAVGTSAAAQLSPMAGKIETDLNMQRDIRAQGDGHNANDPAFAQLRADLLAQYNVATPEELPVNLRGVVATYAETKLTDTLNTYAEARMAAEARQADVLARVGWLSPLVAVADASRAVSGTDLAHYHRFLREAEAVRFAFVQGLNAVHASHVAYADDINRSRDADASARTRVDASHWQVLKDFRLEPEPAVTRLARAATPAMMLALWLGVLFAALTLAARGVRP